MDLTPNQDMQAAARDGLERHERGESGDGLRPATVRRAKRIAAGRALTPEHVRRMAAWFARHGANRQEPGTPWYAAWQLWGGDAGREWAQRTVEAMDAETKADHAPGGAVKALPDEYRLTTRGVVWGGADLVGDTFVRGETDIGATRSFVGMPVYYDHTASGIKSQIGVVTKADEDDEGIVFEVELDRSRRYVADVLALVNAGALGSSTGALSHTVIRRGGTLKRWIIGELSLTPTPAEPRTHPAVKAVDISEPDPTPHEETPIMADEQPTTAATGATPPDLSGELATLAESVKSLSTTVTAVRSDLDDLRSMPAVKAAADLGGAIGGGLNARADEFDGSGGRYHYMKSISRPGSPAKADEYPEAVFGGFAKALFFAQTNVLKASDARKALRDVYGSDPDSTAAKALGTQAGVNGAYMIPEQFVPMLMQIARQNDALYGRTMVIPADGGEIVIPALDHSGAFVEGQSNYYGGATVTWGDDDSSTVETQPKFKQVRLKTNALKARTRVKNSLLMRSAITIDAVISQILGAVIGRARDYALMRGTGSGQPLGFLNAPATIDAGGSAIDFATLAGMEDDVIPERDDNYVWAIHTKARSAIYALQQTNNTLVTWLPDLRGKPQAVLLGRPIVWTDKLPFASGDVSNRVNLIDPSMIVCAEYQGIALAVSDQVRFEDDETVFRAILSMDAQPWLTSKIEIATSEYVSGFITI
jgi:HK97 family phage major capsid protein